LLGSLIALAAFFFSPFEVTVDEEQD
jgi:hypothetical protein